MASFCGLVEAVKSVISDPINLLLRAGGFVFFFVSSFGASVFRVLVCDCDLCCNDCRNLPWQSVCGRLVCCSVMLAHVFSSSRSSLCILSDEAIQMYKQKTSAGQGKASKRS